MSSGVESGRLIRVANEEVTWAGECPWTESFCFGTESGKVFFYKNTGDDLALDFAEVLAEEAINGAAFYDDFVGVSTRSEVIVYRRTPGNRFDLLVAGPGGAHGILATPRGQFLAPVGPDGLFCADVSVIDDPRMWNERTLGVSLNHYSLTRLGNVAGKEILACAGRTDGMIRLHWDAANEQSLITTLTAPDVDCVDVCSLGSARWPFAVAALCLDRSVVLVRNLLTDDQPQTLRIDGIRGMPYAILCAMGHIFILTSQYVTVFPKLADWYLEGDQIDAPLYYRQRSVHADDMFITHEKDLLVLTDDGVEIDYIPQMLGSNGTSSQARIHAPETVPLLFRWGLGAPIQRVRIPA